MFYNINADETSIPILRISAPNVDYIDITDSNFIFIKFQSYLLDFHSPINTLTVNNAVFRNIRTELNSSNIMYCNSQSNDLQEISFLSLSDNVKKLYFQNSFKLRNINFTQTVGNLYFNSNGSGLFENVIIHIYHTDKYKVYLTQCSGRCTFKNCEFSRAQNLSFNTNCEFIDCRFINLICSRPLFNTTENLTILQNCYFSGIKPEYLPEGITQTKMIPISVIPKEIIYPHKNKIEKIHDKTDNKKITYSLYGNYTFDIKDCQFIDMFSDSSSSVMNIQSYYGSLIMDTCLFEECGSASYQHHLKSGVIYFVSETGYFNINKTCVYNCT